MSKEVKETQAEKQPLEEETEEVLSQTEAESTDGEGTEAAIIQIPQDDHTRLLKAEKELKELKDKMLRTVSEFENSKRRVEKEKEEFVQYALKNVLLDFIPVLENLQLALKSSQESASVDSLKQGFEMIGKQIMDVLSLQGLKQIEAEEKPFDPHFHEAIGTVETDEFEEDTVVEVISQGYLYKERLLKPAMVKVSKKSS